MSRLEATEGLARAETCAKNRGGQFLSKTWQGTVHRYTWKCACRQTWRAPFNLVVNHGTWCPRCATAYKARIRRKSESAAWSEFDEMITKTWPSGSRRITTEFPGTHHGVEVHCGSCLRTHRPVWRNIVKRGSWPRCLVGKHISAGTKGRAKPELRLPGDEAAFRLRLRNIKMGARTRGLVFELSDEFVRHLVLSDCFWCGRPPSECGKMITPTGRRFSGDLKATFGPCIGIDRLDSALGYIPGNVLASCEMCNVAKMNYRPGLWLSWLSCFTPHRISLIQGTLLARSQGLLHSDEQ